MTNFNLEDYEPVEERLERFHNDYKEGRVITELVSNQGDTIMFKASLFRDFAEEKPWATGFAEETKGENGPVNKYSHVENCETSAIGRALANAGYAPKGKRPSREEMTKVQRLSSKPAEIVNPAPSNAGTASSPSVSSKTPISDANARRRGMDEWRAKPATPKQTAWIHKRLTQAGYDANKANWTGFTAGMASDYLEQKLKLDELVKILGYKD